MKRRASRTASTGRMARRRFWWMSLAVWAIGLPLLDLLSAHAPAWAVAGLAGLILAAVFGLSVLRLHDRNRSAAWLAVIFVPLLGALWLVWQLALRRGTRGPNAYGPDPLASSNDHLTVA